MAAAAGGWFWVGFGAAEGVGPEPVLLGAPPETIRALRPSWSFVGLVEAAGGARLVARRGSGAASAAVPGGACRDLVASERHVVVLREAALEAWRVEGPGAALRAQQPVWRRQLSAHEAAAAGESRAGGQGGRRRCPDGRCSSPASPLPRSLLPAELPLVAGGYVEPRAASFFRPLSPALRARQLALGHEHALLLAAAAPDAGHLFAWGAGRHGQLGHGDLASAAEPRLVEALQGVPLGQVAAGGWHSAAVGEAGELYLWGWNESGQLGLPAKGMMGSPGGATTAEAQCSRRPSGGLQAPQESPPAAFISIQAFPALLDMPEEADVSKVSCGSRHTAALTRTGELYTWGWGKYGQLGHRNTATCDRPTKVCCFEAWGLGVAEVVCGPWTTFVLALPLSHPQRHSCQRAEHPEESSACPPEDASGAFLPAGAP
ncbi:LOW QUALITY PROTEIN: RCC1 domain-containing protein 1 [Heteronotia binoei]|uniref:LOW QUALITY PROTEIN: RCC1 domain-containing protein 1 n=1 Tax=Heteronotia binoei TaxID=13085 RepID=UPI0029312A99|nr:LOW QUALITY PROTEIN: RCC1 domain-containing protein 1 [Heteronotia binoei]